MKIITFGRHRSNEVVINDPKVSRNHLQIVQDDNGNFILVDLNTTNGTYINSEKITGEVNLSPNDIVKIGDTPIAWQEYFLQQQPPPPPLPPPPPPPHLEPSRKMWFVVVVIAVILLFVGGGLTAYFIHQAKQAKIEAETEAMQKVKETKEANALAEQKLREFEKAKNKVDSLRNIADKALRKAAESKSQKDRETAEKAQKAADNAQAEADTKAKELQKANAEIKKLKEEKTRLETEKQKLDEENRKLQQDIIKKEKDAKEKLEKEQKAKVEADKKAELTTEFYRRLSKLDANSDYESVCKELNIIYSKKEARNDIEAKFNKANNTEKQKIIDAIKVVPDKKKGEKTNKDKKPADTATNTAKQ
jgi:hypothetical protein